MDGFKTSRMRPLREGERKEKKKEKNEMKTKKKKAQEFECLSNADVDRILMATLYIGELNSGVGGRDLTYVSSQTILLVYLYV